MRLNIKNKYWVLICIGLIALLALFIILVHLLTSGTAFSLHTVFINLAVSLPFMALIVWLDYKLIDFLDNSSKAPRNIFFRIILEGILIILLAICIVVIGNLPFMGLRDVPAESILISVIFNIFAAVLIEFYIHIRKSQQLQQEYLKMQYRQLKNQINPHFLFNSLNVLVSLINKDGERAIVYVKKLSEVYRYVLTYDIKDTVTLEEELAFINNYMDILKIRFGKRMEFISKVDKEALHLKIPPMTLQILVENSVKHNVSTISNPLTIHIESSGRFLTVFNNVNPREPDNYSNGVGLSNLREKYLLLTRQSISVRHDEKCFIVTLPLL